MGKSTNFLTFFAPSAHVKEYLSFPHSSTKVRHTALNSSGVATQWISGLNRAHIPESGSGRAWGWKFGPTTPLVDAHLSLTDDRTVYSPYISYQGLRHGDGLCIYQLQAISPQYLNTSKERFQEGLIHIRVWPEAGDIATPHLCG